MQSNDERADGCFFLSILACRRDIWPRRPFGKVATWSHVTRAGARASCGDELATNAARAGGVRGRFIKAGDGVRSITGRVQLMKQVVRAGGLQERCFGVCEGVADAGRVLSALRRVMRDVRHFRVADRCVRAGRSG